MLGAIVTMWLAGGLSAHAEDAVTDDPYLWLEDVTGERALGWVAEQNKKSLGELTASPGYDALRTRLLSILDSDDRIPYVEEQGGFLYNFWQDADHKKGLWRRTTWDAYRTAQPTWEVLLDLDALSAAEGESWVWHGSDCLAPDYSRCLLALSRGGSDADVTREFDLGAKAFVTDGFFVPEAKGQATWIDRDTLFVSTDFGPGTMTTSGYPQQVRLWRRGTPLAAAELVYEGQDTDISVSGSYDDTPGFERQIISRGITFYTSETFLRRDGRLEKLAVPDDANVSLHREWMLVELRSDWSIGGVTWPQGALLAARLDDFLAGKEHFDALFTPSPTTALAGFSGTRDALVVNVMDDVHNRLVVWRHGEAGWSSAEIGGLPPLSAVSAWPVDDRTSNQLFLTITDFLTPTTLSVIDAGAPDARPEPLKALPAFFDAKGLEISQHFATSADGTRVPYFLVTKAGLKHNGKTPTLLYGYGGFEISLTPSYSGATGAAWLEKGGAYALANIRGGGEYGPAWHQAALKEQRHKAYEDFAAIAKDLITSRVTSPRHLGAMGGSNGGLLMGNMLVQYPELFRAIVCQVPLLDMKRFSHLLAGASWMGEYGDPDDPAQWEFIQTFSPYQLARPDVRYPRTLFTTSTRDDRVHPGHARKMVARLTEQGHDVLYWENTEGGHGGAADNGQRATMWALSWTFLWNELR